MGPEPGRLRLRRFRLHPRVDLRAERAQKLATRTTNVAQEVVPSAAKSMFHSVLPNNNGQQQNSSSASQFTD